jgi:hypothetical protein
LIGCSLFVARNAGAHITMDAPNPRFGEGDSSLVPCGIGPEANAANPALIGGTKLTVKWHETVNHDGHYRIGLSSSENDFTVPTDLSVPSPLPGWDLLDGIADTSTSLGTFSATVTLPDKDCPHCVLQLVQIAGLSHDGSNSGGYYANYFACADLSITASAKGGGGTASGGCRTLPGSSMGDLSLLLFGGVALAMRRRQSTRRRGAS